MRIYLIITPSGKKIWVAVPEFSHIWSGRAQINCSSTGISQCVYELRIQY